LEQATKKSVTFVENQGSSSIPGSAMVGDYVYTDTMANHLNEFVTKGTFKGELARPYLNSPLTIQEIQATGTGVRDPGGIPGALRYNVPGVFRGSQGVWELVVDPNSKKIYHFNFVN
jgi:hypothetical protein